MKLLVRNLFFVSLILQFTYCSTDPVPVPNPGPDPVSEPDPEPAPDPEPEPEEPIVIPEEPSLKTVFSEDFTIGAAINAAQITGVDIPGVDLLKTEFNGTTPEDVMKWEEIHPAPDTYNFELPDKYVAFGESNNMQVIGHTLVWDLQIGNWMKQVTDSTLMANYIKNHISTVAGRYKGRIYGWDVVNEALNSDGSLRESIFLKAMGKGYLPFAFKQAEQADPNAELYYNDYSMYSANKREGVVRLVKLLRDNGARIDGIGMQAHWGLESPRLEDVEKSILAYSDLGLKVMITELDINVLPSPSNELLSDDELDPYTNGLPDSVQVKLEERYADIFKLFLKHRDKISRVTFWGVSDGDSWLNRIPIAGRTSYPLLFDREYKPKEAYYKVLALATGEENEVAKSEQ